MPALPAVAKVIRVDLHQNVGSNVNVLNRLFFQYSGAMSQADLVTVLGTISTAYGTQMAANQSSSSALTSVVGTDLSSNTAPQAVNSTVHVGADCATQLPAGTAAVVKFKLGRRYRGGHPHYYAAGICNAELSTANIWVGGFISSLASHFAAFIAACVLAPPAAVGTLTHVNVSYFLGFHNVLNPITGRERSVPSLRATPVVDAVLSYSVNPKPASQRRRNQQSP